MFIVEFPEYYSNALRLGVLILLLMFQLSILLITHCFFKTIEITRRISWSQRGKTPWQG